MCATPAAMGDSRRRQDLASQTRRLQCSLDQVPRSSGFPQLPGFFKPLEFGEQSVLPRTGCPTPTCSGNPTFQAAPRLTGPKFFPATWAVSPEPLVSLQTEPVEQQRSSFDQHLATEDFQNSDTSGMLNPLSPGGVGAASTSGPRTPFRTGEHVNPGPRGIPVSLHDALPAGQWPHRPAAGEGARRPCGLTRACLWASTRKQRIAAKERSTRRSNALFWKFWRPAAQHSTQQHEVLVPTPHGASAQPEPGCEQECRETALKVGEPTRRKPI